MGGLGLSKRLKLLRPLALGFHSAPRIRLWAIIICIYKLDKKVDVCSGQLNDEEDEEAEPIEVPTTMGILRNTD